jgi:tellurite resistance protein TerC
VFGIFILATGVSTFFKNKNFVPKIFGKLEKYMDIYKGDHKGRFFVMDDGKRKITVLTLAVFCIEICDITFAFDSIPAIFSITNNKTIIYTSNTFALIGMRSLYILFATIVGKFHYLQHCVSIILCFIGMKMIFADYVCITPLASLSIVSLILLTPFIISVSKSFIEKNR